jgi:trehalose synthase
MNNDALEQYKKITGPEKIDQLYQLADPLKKMKLVHVNSTAMGGGVAEILTKLVPMTKALGIDTSWEVIQGTLEFFQCTKGMHNAIQGMKHFLSPTDIKVYEEVNRLNAEKLRDVLESADIVVIHDPQPLALIKHFPNRKGKWIWRCHIDASRPFRPVWKYLRTFIERYDASIFSLAEFTHPLPHPMFVIPPSIDPLSEKNMDLDPKEVEKVYDIFNLDRERPIILQVSRFDRFKDPLGVIEAYRFVKKFNSEMQLVLAGNSASDDPEGDIVLKEVQDAARGDPGIHILLMPGDAPRTINALQRVADIVLQKSIKEGFGLTVTETLWKSKPVIGGNTGGIRMQVIHGETGFVVNTPEGAAYRIRYFLQHPEKSMEMGEKGKEFVREKFLITRQLREYLTLMYSLISSKTDRIELPMVKHDELA